VIVFDSYNLRFGAIINIRSGTQKDAYPSSVAPQLTVVFVLGQRNTKQTKKNETNEKIINFPFVSFFFVCFVFSLSPLMETSVECGATLTYVFELFVIFVLFFDENSCSADQIVLMFVPSNPAKKFFLACEPAKNRKEIPEATK
jgi:hypothetical protein